MIIACDLPIDSGIEGLIAQIRTLPVGIQVCPKSLIKFPSDAKCLVQFGLPMISIAAKPLAGREQIVKRLEDIVLAVVLLIVLAPITALIALLVRLDTPGPAIFRQKRFGFNGEVIEVFKFRTMHAEHGLDPMTPQARRNDQRVTRFGRIIRASSLDELPQLLNVLKGEMSMVGPRPHAVAHNEHYAKLIGGYMARHRVKPGITGWAQINGLRGETTPASMRARVEHDLFYIENWSLLFDLKILVRTALVGFGHQYAY